MEDATMNERIEELLGVLWKMEDDVESVIQCLNDLERLYEHEGDVQKRRIVVFTKLMIKPIEIQLQNVTRDLDSN